MYTEGQELIRHVDGVDHPVAFVIQAEDPDFAMVIDENDDPIKVAMSDLRPATPQD